MCCRDTGRKTEPMPIAGVVACEGCGQALPSGMRAGGWWFFGACERCNRKHRNRLLLVLAFVVNIIAVVNYLLPNDAISTVVAEATGRTIGTALFPWLTTLAEHWVTKRPRRSTNHAWTLMLSLVAFGLESLGRQMDAGRL